LAKRVIVTSSMAPEVMYSGMDQQIDGIGQLLRRFPDIREKSIIYQNDSESSGVILMPRVNDELKQNRSLPEVLGGAQLFESAGPPQKAPQAVAPALRAHAEAVGVVAQTHNTQHVVQNLSQAQILLSNSQGRTLEANVMQRRLADNFYGIAQHQKNALGRNLNLQ
jgi:hypothetical protein